MSAEALPVVAVPPTALEFRMMPGALDEVASAHPVSSTGGEGYSHRPAERGYHNEPQLVTDASTFIDLWQETSNHAISEDQKRRAVLRAVVTADVARAALDAGLPVEAAISLSDIYPDSTDVLMYVATNVTEPQPYAPEASGVIEDWSMHTHRTPNPLETMQYVEGLGYSFIDTPNREHAAELARFWSAFGWTEEGIAEFIENFSVSPADKLFSGITDADGHLVAACTSEGITMAGYRFIEVTEFFTDPDHRGKGLMTAALSGLVAQIYSRVHDTSVFDGVRPVIYAELNMAKRSDKPARDAGMTIPGLHDETIPFPVLHQNVIVFDGGPGVIFERMDPVARDYFEDSLAQVEGQPLRDFIVGVLPDDAIAEYYANEQVHTMVTMYQRRIDREE
jgi:GNAT superfamily N-acetyltransferase